MDRPSARMEGASEGACRLQPLCLPRFPLPSELRPLISAPSFPSTLARFAWVKTFRNAACFLPFFSSLEVPVLSLEMSCQIRSQISQEYPSKLQIFKSIASESVRSITRPELLPLLPGRHSNSASRFFSF